jgi:hypothetical protein
MSVPVGGSVRRWAFRGLLLLSLTGALLAYGGPLLFQLRGQTLLVLTSGSMAPRYPAGTAVVAEPVTPDQLRVGQIVTFKHLGDNGSYTYVTHQIKSLRALQDTDQQGNPLVDASGNKVVSYYVQTIGTANHGVPDPNLTPVEQVRYLVVDGYPEVGYWLTWSRSLTGRFVLFAPAFLLLLAAEMWSWRRTRPPVGGAAPEPRRSGQRHDDVAGALV